MKTFVAIEVQDNSAELFWEELETRYPAIADALRSTQRVIVLREVWHSIALLPESREAIKYQGEASESFLSVVETLHAIYGSDRSIASGHWGAISLIECQLSTLA